LAYLIFVNNLKAEQIVFSNKLTYSSTLRLCSIKKLVDIISKEEANQSVLSTNVVCIIRNCLYDSLYLYEIRYRR